MIRSGQAVGAFIYCAVGGCIDGNAQFVDVLLFRRSDLSRKSLNQPDVSHYRRLFEKA
jgi:hypothetical protein